jgi:hypothetical protein
MEEEMPSLNYVMYSCNKNLLSSYCMLNLGYILGMQQPASHMNLTLADLLYNREEMQDVFQEEKRSDRVGEERISLR